MDWDDFKFVQAVAQTGSVRAAGELLQVHGSTVARHLDQLEERVGTRLFERTPRGMRMTPAGAEVIDALDRVATELGDVERSLRARGPALDGPVALATTAPLASGLVVPRLGDLYHRHPDLELMVTTASALQQLQLGDADLALWLTDDPPEDLVGRPLGPVMACAYRAGTVEPAQRWVGSGEPESLSTRVRTRWFPHLPLGLRLDDVDAQAVALEAGLGTGLLPCHVGDARPGLERAGAMAPVREGEAWLFSRPESRGAPRIRAVSAFLQGLFAANRGRLQGSQAADQEVS